MSSFAIQIIAAIIILGGVIAYFGNMTGKYIGKKRLTLFRLRPRYTAIIITIISGILIAFSTAAVLLVVSQDARTALLGLDKLKGEINLKAEELKKANQDLEKLNKELGELEKAKTLLGKEVKAARQGQVIFRIGEVISLSLIKGGAEKDKIENGLKQIIAAADSSIRNLGVKSENALVEVSDEEFNQAVYGLLNEDKVFIVKLVAERNVLWGEAVPAGIELAENKLIYKNGQEMASRDLPKGLTATQAEQEITFLLRGLHQAARDAGVLPDAAGSLGSIPYAQISDLAKKIAGARRNLSVKVIAGRDIFSIGPLDAKFKIVNK